MSFASIRSHRAKGGLPALLITLLLLAGSPAVAGGKQVRLLIPILTGSELDQVRKLAPTAAIVTINGETFLEVGTFSDARVAHRLGRSIQKRLSIPFDLAYDPGHPQIALALGDEPQKPASPVAQLPPVVKPLAVVPAPKPVASDPIWQPMVAGLQAAKPDVGLPTPQQAKRLDAVEAAAPIRSDPTNDRIEALRPQPKPSAQPEPVLADNLKPLVQADAGTRLSSVEALPSSEVGAVGEPLQPAQAVVEVPPEAIPAVDIAASSPLTEPQLEPQITTDIAPAQRLVESHSAPATVSTDVQPLEAASAATTSVALAAPRAEPEDVVEAEPLLTGNTDRLGPEMQPAQLPSYRAQQNQADSSILIGGLNSNKSPVSSALERRAEAATQQLPSAVAPESSEPQTAFQRSARLRIPGRLAMMDRQHTRLRPQAVQPSSAPGGASQAAAQAQTVVKTHPWLRPVEIAAVKIDVPLSRSGVAVNPNLNYLYVKIQKPTDVARLNRITPVMELNPVGDAVVARIGVFTKTRTGQRLMQAQIKRLKQQQVDLIVADGGRPLDVVSQA